MLIRTFKLNKKRLALITLAAAALLIALIVFLSAGGGRANSASSTGAPSAKDAGTAEKRVEYIRAYGWEVKPEPVEFEEVLIPQTFDGVFADYAALQEGQGFNLEKYKGKRVTRYSHEVLNYPGVTDGSVRCNVYVYKNDVIAGDVCSIKLDGFMHGFAKS